MILDSNIAIDAVKNQGSGEVKTAISPQTRSKTMILDSKYRFRRGQKLRFWKSKNSNFAPDAIKNLDSG
jgi:hypothetical protein